MVAKPDLASNTRARGILDLSTKNAQCNFLGRASWRKATRCEEQPQEGKTSVILNQNYD